MLPCVAPQGCVPLEAAHHIYDLVLPYQNAALEAAKRAFQVKHANACVYVDGVDGVRTQTAPAP